MGDLKRVEGGTLFFIMEEAKDRILDFPEGTATVLWMPLYNFTTACFSNLFWFITRSI